MDCSIFLICCSGWVWESVPTNKVSVAILSRSNHRLTGLISILPAMCKLFGRILTEDVYDHLSRNYLITSAQYGFIKGRSTELQLLNCSYDWVNAIDT